MVTVVTIQTQQNPVTVVVADAAGTAVTHPPTMETISPDTARTVYLYGSKRLVMTETEQNAPATDPAAPGEG